MDVVGFEERGEGEKRLSLRFHPSPPLHAREGVMHQASGRM
jgi:hypothetical protein